jgi:hypothetical protein
MRYRTALNEGTLVSGRPGVKPSDEDAAAVKEIVRNVKQTAVVTLLP